MTIREFISKKKKIISILEYIGIAIFIVLLVISILNGLSPAYPFFIFIVYYVIISMLSVFIKCPICKEKIGAVLMTEGPHFSVPKKIKYCPYCGTSIDEEIEI